MSEHASSDWSTVPAKAGAVFRRSATSGVAFFNRRGRRATERLSKIDLRAPADLRRAVSLPSEATLWRICGWAMILLATLVVGFVIHLTLISHLAESRSQQLLFTQFRTELASGTAPVGQVDVNGALLEQGDPVALLRIPALGLSQTVVEGTSSRALLDGPGHRRDTPLPGQQGVSVIYGRQAAYGGPFGRIDELRIGDTITTTTGQGESTFRVSAIRHVSDKVAPLASAAAGRLTLVSAAGPIFMGNRVVRVDADLTGTAQPTPEPVLVPGSLTKAEDPLASDRSGWLPLFLLAELAIVVGAAIVWSLRRWGRWHTWIVAVPVVLALGAGISTQAVVVLPNLY